MYLCRYYTCIFKKKTQDVVTDITIIVSLGRGAPHLGKEK